MDGSRAQADPGTITVHAEQRVCQRVAQARTQQTEVLYFSPSPPLFYERATATQQIDTEVVASSCGRQKSFFFFPFSLLSYRQERPGSHAVVVEKMQALFSLFSFLCSSRPRRGARGMLMIGLEERGVPSPFPPLSSFLADATSQDMRVRSPRRWRGTGPPITKGEDSFLLLFVDREARRFIEVDPEEKEKRTQAGHDSSSLFPSSFRGHDLGEGECGVNSTSCAAGKLMSMNFSFSPLSRQYRAANHVADSKAGKPAKGTRRWKGRNKEGKRTVLFSLPPYYFY